MDENIWLCYSLLVYIPVDGMELGRYLYQHKDTSASVNIINSGDSDDVKLVKSLLSTMIAKDAGSRPSIQEVVDKLTDLLDSLRAQQLKGDIICPCDLFKIHFI